MLKVSPVDVPLCNFCFTRLYSFNCFCDKITPFFVTFTINVLTQKISTKFNFTPTNLLHALAAHFVLVPHSIVLGAFMRLCVLALTMEKTLAHHTLINRPIVECFDALAFRLVVFELTCYTWVIRIDQLPWTFFNAVFPLSLILGAVTPKANSVAKHTTHLPFPIVLPALLLAKEHTMSILKAI